MADLHLALKPGGDLALFIGFWARAKTGQGRRAEIADLHCPKIGGVSFAPCSIAMRKRCKCSLTPRAAATTPPARAEAAE